MRSGAKRVDNLWPITRGFGSTHGKGDLPGMGDELTKFSAGFQLLLIYDFKFRSALRPRGRPSLQAS